VIAKIKVGLHTFEECILSPPQCQLCVGDQWRSLDGTSQ
jgi:hypothetical protein